MTKSESAQITAQTVLLESAEQVLQLRSAAGVRLAIPDTNNLIMVGTADWIAANVPGVEAMVEGAALARATPQHPETPAAAVRAAERIDAMHKGVVGVFAAIKAEHQATTPQHSVTEQAIYVYGIDGTFIRKGTQFDYAAPGEYAIARAQPLASTAAQTEHEDDIAVDRFASAMKAKMAASRAKGRGGWDDPEVCSASYLRTLLVEHIAKGDPVDVGNFAMMLFNLDERTAASEQQAGADELPPLPEPWITNLSAKDPAAREHYARDQMYDYARAALTHRATTAVDGSIDGQLTGAPSAVKKAADQQGDTASECVYVSLQADSLDDWERYVFETCSKAQNIYDLHIRIGDQEWKGSLREVMAALQGAAQAQAGDAPALLRGAVGSVAFVADGLPRVNWMRPERIEAGTLLYVIDRAAMAAPATTGGSNV